MHKIITKPMKVGDLLLVTGPAFFEKTAIKERKKDEKAFKYIVCNIWK